MAKKFIHQELAQGRWFELSLAEQLGNIGSEVSRARKAQGNDQDHFQQAIDRALELFDLTISDSRWHGRLKEIGRAQEVFCDAITGGEMYNSSLADLEKYFNQFALLAMRI